MEEGERGEEGEGKQAEVQPTPTPNRFPCFDYSGFRLHGILIWRVR